MSSYLNYVRAQEHIADLSRAAEQARLARQARELEKESGPGRIATMFAKLRRTATGRETVRPTADAAPDVT